jgi:excinuclease UvrABC nuclease subunit
MPRTFRLDFDGYWRDANIDGVPEEAGVYLVYACEFNKPQGTVKLRKLLYVGEAEDVRTRIKDHEKRDCWEGELSQGEEICFSFTPLDDPNRERAEAALIYQHKPECNDEHKDEFNYETTTVISTGKCKFIVPSFTIQALG